MTNGEQLAKHFPGQFDRIRQIVEKEREPGWLDNDTEMRGPAGTLAAAFSWAETDEGHEHWQKLHDAA